MNLKNIFFMTMMLLVTIPAIGFCFDVTAHVDKTRISKDDSIFLKVEVNGGKADLDLSMVKDFKVISRGSSSSYNYINGKSERKATYQYVLIPLSKGELKIPAIKATRKGQTAFTRQIVIHVSDQVVNSGDVKALFARAEMTNTHLFAGEQAVYTLKFYTSKRLSGLGFENPPEFNGLSSKAFEKEKTYTQNINGILYHVTQVNYIIIPANPGIFNIDPAVLIANVMVKSKRDSRFDSFFNDSFFSSNSFKSIRVVSNPIKIEVSLVPPYQGKGKFSGLVGRFDIEGKMDKTSLKAGESTTFTIKIFGSGNIMDASLPEIDLDIDAFKVYDDNPIETIHMTQTGYEGFKVFKKAIVPVHPGKYVIKPVTLIYFDVDKKVYQRVSTDQIQLDVAPSEEMHLAARSLTGSSNRSLTGPSDKSVVKQEVSLVNKDILEIKEGFAVLKDYKEIEPFFFLLLLSIPAILFSGVKLFIMVTKKELSVEKVMEEKARYHLKQARKMDAKDKGFLGHLYSSLVALILAKGKRKGETVTIKEAQTILIDANVDDTQIDRITHLLETIESVRFGGKKIDGNKAKQLLSKTKQMMKLLCLAIVCLGMFSFVPQKAMANSTATFIDGIKDYKAGHFKQAAKLFETVAKTPVKNPYLFYNIANAYLKANDIGQAILWYERAKILAPNDPDLNFNLAYANTLVKDKKEDAMNIMDVLFFWDKLIPAKIIQVTAIFFSFLFFIWAAIKIVKKQKVFSGTGIILCSIFVLVTAITCVNYYKRSAQLFAVIVQEEIAVRSGVTDTSTKLFSLHAGTKVSVEEQRDGYLKIVFSKGKVGWVKIKEAVII
ncbi:MAG: BatD family protein [Desulfobacula sp.]|uniref:BatD family protein n=1 Tax=Desulfobacula sp. TaxID=2593537 RepID=UPI0025C530FB|nr:BatD family protein [Desulfobacula sp.]MCD4720876.1 BatD family protein [Desulfobacula sp.]